VAIIVQVSFLWPLLARATQALAARLGRDATTGMTLVLGVASALSFGSSLVSTERAPAAAYFDLATRFW